MGMSSFWSFVNESMIHYYNVLMRYRILSHRNIYRAATQTKFLVKKIHCLNELSFGFLEKFSWSSWKSTAVDLETVSRGFCLLVCGEKGEGGRRKRQIYFNHL